MEPEWNKYEEYHCQWLHAAWRILDEFEFYEREDKFKILWTWVVPAIRKFRKKMQKDIKNVEEAKKEKS